MAHADDKAGDDCDAGFAGRHFAGKCTGGGQSATPARWRQALGLRRHAKAMARGLACRWRCRWSVSGAGRT